MSTEYIYDFDSLDKTTQIYYYEKLRENLNYIVYYLNQTYNKLSGLTKDIAKEFNIDDLGPGNIKINSIMVNINSRLNYINYTIIPEINNKINSLK